MSAVAEPSLQPPTREQIESIVVSYGYDRAFSVHGNCIDVADLAAFGRSVADAVLALFPQPAPSAEPVSIADMAPGTTVDVVQRWTVARDERNDFTFLYRENNGYAQMLSPSEVDPSTIRDVTPPN